MRPAKNQPTRHRRKFLTDIVRTAGGVGLMALGVGLFARQSAALPATAIRPPGALPEDDFLGACIRCGLCVRDCPYDTLRLSKPGEPVPTGTPYFVARGGALRDVRRTFPASRACPSRALDRKLEKIDDARMGLAVLIDQENCIAFQGLRCEVCFNVWSHPRQGDHPRVRAQPAQWQARALPAGGALQCLHRLWQVRGGLHPGGGRDQRCCRCIWPRGSWVITTVWAGRRSGGAGGALVSPDQPHHYNLPKNLDYDLQGQGLLKKEGDKEAPYSSNPLDTLNRKGGL